jgi:hypothetical protein
MYRLRDILAAFADAHSEHLQLDYDQGDSTWIAPPTIEGADLTW